MDKINLLSSSSFLIKSGTENFNLLRSLETYVSVSVVEWRPLPVMRSISLYLFLVHRKINSLTFIFASLRVKP